MLMCVDVWVSNRWRLLAHISILCMVTVSVLCSLFSRLCSLVYVLLNTELALRFGHISCWCVLTCGFRTGGDCLRLNEAISKDGSEAAQSLQ